MAYGTTVLIKNQFGLEAAHGTAVAADTGLICGVTLPSSDRDVIVPAQGSGRRVPEIIDNAHVGKIAAEGITLDFETPYFQAFPMMFSASVKGNITPAEQNVGEGDYLWAFTDNLTGTEEIDTFTLETGEAAADNSWEIAYCLSPGWTLTGNCDTGEGSFSVNVDGDAILPTTLTGAIAQPTATMLVSKLMRVYVDDTWAGLGGTELTAALVDYTIAFDSGVHHKRRGAANRKPSSHGQGKMIFTITLGLERTAAVVTEIGHLLSETPTKRYLRLVLDSGVQIGAGDNHTLTLDCAGVWSEGPITGRDLDGNDLVELVLTTGYDKTGAHAFDLDVITNVTAI